MSDLRVLVVSDTHLSPQTPEADSNWAAIAAYTSATMPAVVVHAGDLTLDGTRDGPQLEYARARLDALAVPWVAVPGNHDVGDNPQPESSDEETDDDYVVTAERRQRWLDAIGPDRWTLQLDAWTLLGINAQLFESGLDAEGEQWEWLEAAREKDGLEKQQTVLVTHKPLTATPAEIETSPVFRFVPRSAWTRMTSHVPNVIVSGHVHQYRVLDLDARRHVWAPTTWAVLPEDWQATVGTKRCGVVELTLHDDGTAGVALVEPAGLRQLTLNEDVASPYD